MKRPLVPVALLYAGGILLADWFSLAAGPLLGYSALLVMAAIAWQRMRHILLGGLILVTGLTNQSLHTVILSENDLRFLIGENKEPVTLRGTLTETPYQRIYVQDEESSIRTAAFLETQAVLLQATNWQPALGRVMVTTIGALPTNFFGGQTVEITGFLQQPKTAAAPGLFDYRAYLRRQGIYYQLHARSQDAWRLLSTATAPPVADRFGSWAQAILARGLPTVDEPLQLLWAMTLGWKTALSGEVSEPFMRSGTMHIFAISGLHIALIAAILVKVLRLFRVPRPICGLVVIPVIWFYTGVTGWQASAIRSTIMSTVIVAGWSLNRPSDLLNSLAAAAFLILLWDPQQLFQASFQLSFFVVLSLALVIPVFTNFRDQLLRQDPFLPEELVPRWRRRFNSAVRFLSTGLITSLAAWIGSAPLIAYYFHLFTPGSLVANILVVPLSSFALASNLASLVVGSWFPACAELFNHSAWFFMVLMIKVSEWVAWFPRSCFYVATPTPLSFFVYYAILLSALAGWLTRPHLRRFAITASSFLLLLWLAQCYMAYSATRLTILPLSGGEAIFLDAPGNKSDCLVDCGGKRDAHLFTEQLLRAQGVNVLPRFILTHGDTRHVSGAETIRAGFSVSEVCFSPAPARSRAYRDIRAQFGNTPGLSRTVKCKDRPGPWTVLHPDISDRYPRADDNALVLAGEFAGVQVLLLSDLGKSGQNALVTRNPDLHADIVVAGLPSADEPLADGLIKQLRPKLIIITDAEFPAQTRAGKKLQERLADHGIAILYTRETGTITITFQSNHFDLHSISGADLQLNTGPASKNY